MPWSRQNSTWSTFWKDTKPSPSWASGPWETAVPQHQQSFLLCGQGLPHSGPRLPQFFKVDIIQVHKPSFFTNWHKLSENSARRSHTGGTTPAWRRAWLLRCETCLTCSWWNDEGPCTLLGRPLYRDPADRISCCSRLAQGAHPGWHLQQQPEQHLHVAAGAHLSLAGTGCLDEGVAGAEVHHQGHVQCSVWEYLPTPSTTSPTSHSDSCPFPTSSRPPLAAWSTTSGTWPSARAACSCSTRFLWTHQFWTACMKWPSLPHILDRKKMTLNWELKLMNVNMSHRRHNRGMLQPDPVPCCWPWSEHLGLYSSNLLGFFLY